MKDKKLTVTIGIPAYNEEKNISFLITSLFEQDLGHISLEKIIVISDGSTDKTADEVKKISDRKVKLILGKKRIGKPQRLNQLFKLVDTEILLQLDADIRLKSKKIIQDLISPFLKDSKVSIVFGRVEPIQPTTIVEKLSFLGFSIWEEAKKNLGSRADAYRSVGQMRAFSKTFFKKFRFPKGLGSAEDTYSFYFAKSGGLKVVHQENAISVFRLASTFRDYIMQMTRYLKNNNEIKKYFDQHTIDTYNTISFRVKMDALRKIISKSNPYIVVLYLLLQAITYFVARFTKYSPVWVIASSTKKIMKMKIL